MATSDTVSAPELAALFNLTDRRIRQLAAAGVIPKAGHGKYLLAEAVKGYVQFLQSRAYARV